MKLPVLRSYSGFKNIGFISIILVIAVVFVLFYFLQSATEDRIKNELFQKQLQRQTESAQSTSQHIGSDLDSLLARLQIIASSPNLQTQNLVYSSKISSAIQQMKNQISPELGQYLDNIFIADKNGIIRFNYDQGNANNEKISIIGRNISSLDYVNKTKTNLIPVFSNASTFVDNKFSIIITYPIINNTIGQINNNNNYNKDQKDSINRYLGLVGISIPISKFFNNYGNTQNLNTQFFRAYDKNGTILVNPMKQLIGKNYFSNYIQHSINHNIVLNNLIKALILSGQSGTKVFDLGLGERLIITQPIFARNTPQYFMALITPTSSIYSDIDNILSLQRSETLTLFIGLSIAIIILIIIYIKWNTILRKEVDKKTGELDVSNKQLKRLNKHLSSANKQLEINAKIQSEFINLAAHELKTPAQSILGYTELLMMEEDVNNSSIKNNNNDRDNSLTVRYASAANRNALRLQRLIKDILDVARIESNTLRLTKERFDLVESINYIISDIVHTQVVNTKTNNNNDNNTEIVFNKQVTTLFVFADKMRIDEVISNLIINAINITKDIRIIVSIQVAECAKSEIHLNDYHNDNNNDDKNDKDDKICAIVAIEDNGTGIDPEIKPKLFTKFASKSKSGLGLGLYISKSIIEAHGGKIWAENNVEGKGTTFRFSLPITNYPTTEKCSKDL